jgi:hypothetical protein
MCKGQYWFNVLKNQVEKCDLLDFESCASTSSATRAQAAIYIVGVRARQKKIITWLLVRRARNRACIHVQDRQIAAARYGVPKLRRR